MPSRDSEPQIDRSLIIHGLEWAQEQYIQGSAPGIEEGLKSLYFSGLSLYAHHRQGILERIDEAGGVRNIIRADPDGRLNLVECNNGHCIGADEMLGMEPIDFPVPSDADYSEHFTVRRDGHLRLSFGGVGGGLDASTSDKALASCLIGNALETILSGDFVPNSVAITESLATRYDDADAVVISGLCYQVTGQHWQSKLREEFAPKRYKDPEAYWAWVATEPLPQMDVSFVASPEPSREAFSHGMALASHIPQLKTHFSKTNFIRPTPEGVEKAIRFSSLLGTIWKHEFGTDVPIPDSRPEQKAIEGPSIRVLSE